MTSLLDQIIAEAGRVILGKERVLRLALTCLGRAGICSSTTCRGLA
jgi:hypothetical protein